MIIYTLITVYIFLSLLPAWTGEHWTIPRLGNWGFGHLLTAPHQPRGCSHLCQLTQLHWDRGWEKHVVGRHPPSVPPPWYAHWCFCFVPFPHPLCYLFDFNRLIIPKSAHFLLILCILSHDCPIFYFLNPANVLFLFFLLLSVPFEFPSFISSLYQALCPPLFIDPPHISRQ